MDEAERLEEEQDLRVRTIQKAFRSMRARRLVRELVAAHFVKEYDRDRDRFYYRNKLTGVRQRKKPMLLGDIDLPTPRVFYAPRDYSAGTSDVRQFALVLYCGSFDDSKSFPTLAPCLERDHEALREALVNPFLGKFEEKNCVFVCNASAGAIVDAVETLSRLVRSTRDLDLDEKNGRSALFVYLCTHTLHVVRGRHRGTYFCFADTNAATPSSIRNTALSAKRFCELLAQVECTEKVVALDCCHRPRPKDTLLRVVLPYPPKDLYESVARDCDCLVLGSCKLRPSGSLPESAAPTSPKTRSLSIIPSKMFGGSWLPRMSLERGAEGRLDVVDEIDIVRSWPRRLRESARQLSARCYDAHMLRNRERRERKLAAKRRRPPDYEVARYDDQRSTFGGAVVRALSGEAAEPPEQRISFEMLFNYVRLALENSAQTPQAASGATASCATVCCAPSPPPPPYSPHVLEVSDRTALLAWENPRFSGAPPLRYELQSRGTAKYDSQEWAPCAAWATITSSSFRVPHLVPGLAVRFRVRALNRGGWSSWSEGSDFVVPMKSPLEGLALDMRRAAVRGLPAVLEAMRARATISEAQKFGAWQLVTVATKQRGFKRTAVARDCCAVVQSAMRAFALDAKLQATGCLLIGWCFYRRAPFADEVARTAHDVIDVACANFPADVAVASNAAWARSRLPRLADVSTG